MYESQGLVPCFMFQLGWAVYAAQETQAAMWAHQPFPDSSHPVVGPEQSRQE